MVSSSEVPQNSLVSVRASRDFESVDVFYKSYDDNVMQNPQTQFESVAFPQLKLLPTFQTR